MKKSLVYPLLALASVIWGVSFIITKELFRTEPHITVFVILTFRLLLATAVTIPALLLFKKLEPIKKGDLKWFLLLALFEPFIYSICETSGVQLVSGSMASIVVATIPLFVPFGMAVAYKEKVRAVTLVGIVLSLVGLAVMLLPGDSGNLDANPAGLAWLAGAVLTAVFFTIVLVKLVDRYRPLTITAYQNMFGCLYFIPFMLIFCSTVAYVCYNVGVAKLGASAACIFTNVIPVFSLIAALLIGQEQLSWSKPVGMAIVIVGVVLAQMELRKKQAK